MVKVGNNEDKNKSIAKGTGGSTGFSLGTLGKVLIVPAVAGILYTGYSLGNQPADDEPTSIGDLDEHAVELVDEEEDAVELDYETIDIPGYPSQIYLEDGQATTNIQLVNPENNSVYFKFQLGLAAENSEEPTVLYESGLVKPGQVVKEQDLSEPLTEGNHEAYLLINTYSMDTDEEMNGARLKLEFIVE